MTETKSHNDWLLENPLRRWRLENEMSRLEFCSRTGFQPMSVLRWEKGATTPRWENIKLVAAQMGIKPEALMLGWDEWMEDRP